MTARGRGADLALPGITAMSKFVKDLISQEFGKRLSGVNECLLVNVVGLNAIQTQDLRKQFRAKGMNLMVVKNSLARRATTGGPLASAFETAEGTLAVVWGGEDIVSLAKEVARLAEDKKAFEKFQAKGGVIDGQAIPADQVKEVAKWPSRKEQLSLLVGQILGPGASLVAQILGPGRTVAGQVKKKGEGDEGGGDEAAPAS